MERLDNKNIEIFELQFNISAPIPKGPRVSDFPDPPLLSTAYSCRLSSNEVSEFFVYKI